MQKPDRRAYLTQTPIPRLIWSLAVPTIISMLVTGIYNSADTYFVGRISTQATAAVGLVFSIMAIIQALGFFCGHGSGNSLSRMRGAGRTRDANEMAATGFALALAIYLAWSFITMQWQTTWIVWPIAGVLYGVVEAGLRLTRKNG